MNFSNISGNSVKKHEWKHTFPQWIEVTAVTWNTDHGRLWEEDKRYTGTFLRDCFSITGGIQPPIKLGEFEAF